MEYREFRGKSVQDAITEAQIAFETTSDNIEYEVVEEGGGGLFGMFSKEAVIKARVKDGAEVTAEAVTLEELKPVYEPEEKETEAPETEGTEPAKSAAKAAPASEAASAEAADFSEVKEFLEDVLSAMDVNVSVNLSVDEEQKLVSICFDGDKVGDIIGKRGTTLDALQYLAGIVANRGRRDYYRVLLDAKNYRERRQKTLENLARNVASKVKRTRHKVVLEPMNAYERRIIHSYLQGDRYVTTNSEGEEPNRRVVVFYNR